MNNQAPTKITILRGSQNDYTVLIDALNTVECADRLSFDEMLGFVARMFVPVGSDGYPLRNTWCQPLFLQKPEPPHPDAAGDKPPVVQLRDGQGNLTGMWMTPDPKAGSTLIWADGIDGRKFTDFHWQVRHTVNGEPKSIWNIYPTSKKVKIVIDPEHKGPKISIPEPLTLQACIDAVRKQIEANDLIF